MTRTLDEWAKYIEDYCEIQGWNKGLTFEKATANCHSEISEAWEEYRDGHDILEVYHKNGKPEGIPVELADTIIRILHLVGHYNIPIETIMEEKMRYNETRSYRHGNKIA